MKKINIHKALKIFVIFFLSCLGSYFLVNSTYDSIKTRVQTLHIFEPNFMILHAELPFDFNYEIYKIVNNVKNNSKNNNNQNCKLEKDIIPISISSDNKKYTLEIIGSNLDENEKCLNDIFSLFSQAFYQSIKKKIENTNLKKKFLRELYYDKKSKLDISINKEISISNLLKLLEQNKIKKIYFKKNKIFSVNSSGESYLTFSNNETLNFIFQKFNSEKIEFNFIETEFSNINDELINVNLINYEAEIKYYQSLLTKSPFNYIEINNNLIKISKIKYLFTIIILINIISFSIFLILSKDYKKIVKIFY